MVAFLFIMGSYDNKDKGCGLGLLALTGQAWHITQTSTLTDIHTKSPPDTSEDMKMGTCQLQLLKLNASFSWNCMGAGK